MAPNVCGKTQFKTYFVVHTKNKSSSSLWEKIVGKRNTKAFRESLGKFGKKSLAPPKICLRLHLWTARLKILLLPARKTC